ncbi:MAG: hypothetical protein ACOX1Y_12925 [Zhaonellaceae bacterium]
MINLFWPILIVVAANTLYNICTKLTPSEVQPLASLSITYLTATLLSVLLLFFTSENKDVITEIQKADWTAVALGFSVVALEFGYIYIYRVGWNVSTGSLVANISLACVFVNYWCFYIKREYFIPSNFGNGFMYHWSLTSN